MSSINTYLCISPSAVGQGTTHICGAMNGTLHLKKYDDDITMERGCSVAANVFGSRIRDSPSRQPLHKS